VKVKSPRKLIVTLVFLLLQTYTMAKASEGARKRREGAFGIQYMAH
jgi:hypothetical protein